jgi:dihydrofolate reductase
MRVSFVVAMAENRAIGRDGGLPWHLPADLRHFKNLTIDHTVVMGRKTFDEVGRPLPRRRNVVVTRQRDWSAEGVEVVHGLDAALELVRGEAEVFIIGGAEIYRQALPRTDRIYLTRVETEVEGDVFFPEIDWDEWRIVAEEHHPADDRHAYAMTFLTYERRRGEG